MATIKDVAAAAGVSATTVSLILNGKASDRKISQTTHDKVMTAMQELDYHPNLSARRLRSNDLKKPGLAFFWPSDYRTNIMATFINYFQGELKAHNYDCEFIVQTYENDKLCQDASVFTKNSYSGIIIGAASLNDVKFLEDLNCQTPIILINRTSKKFSTVYVDDVTVGQKAAQLIFDKGYREVVLFSSDFPYVATGFRTKAFKAACTKLGIAIKDKNIIRCANTITGGVVGAEQYCKLKNPPKAIFFESDFTAKGALYTFHKHNIRIPEDVELLSVSLLSPENTSFTIPSLSVIEVPQEAVSKEAINILMQLLNNNFVEPIHSIIQPKVVLRESFKL